MKRIRPAKRKYGLQPRVTLRTALTDPALLGDVLAGPSWNRWKALLLATVGEPLTADELILFRESTGREQPPTELVDEAAFVIGRRGGKDRAISVLSVWLGALCEHPALARGERGIVLCIGADQRQAKVQRDYVEGALLASPILSKLITGTTQDTISLSNRIDIEVRSANFRRNRGLTCIGVIASECAFWFSDEYSANPDSEILNAVRPTLATTRGPLIMISSPYARRGELWETYRRHYGPNGDPRILVAQGASRTFNPTLPQSVVDRALERDPAGASAEYLAQFRTDVEAFIAREVVEAVTVPGRYELPPMTGQRYVAFADPSGGSSDSMTLAIAHREDDSGVLDCLREWRPPFSPDSVVREAADLLKSYRLHKVTGDRYAGEWPRERFRTYGIVYEPSELSKSDLYRELLPLLNSGRLELLDNKRLTNQLCSLERRTARSGKDSVDHPPGMHDDLCNAPAGALVNVARRRQLISSDAALLQAQIRIPRPSPTARSY